MFLLLHLATLGIPLPAKLSSINLSCLLRIELLELTTQIPFIKAISISLIKKPYINFSLQFLHVDTMNLGATSELNTSKIILDLIHSNLNDILIYPKKVIIPIQSMGSEELAHLSELLPMGILTLTIKSAGDLPTFNLFSKGKSVIPTLVEI